MNKAKTTDDGYELRTHAGVDFEILDGEQLCPGCEGDGRTWKKEQSPAFPLGAGRYIEKLCAVCFGRGKCVKE